MSVDIEQELAEANARLPVAVSDMQLPMDMQLRTIALTIAQRYVSDTVIKEGGLYQQLKMDNKLGTTSIEEVVRFALILERYLWGEWSKGIAENAMGAISTEAADAIEKEINERLEKEFKDELPTRPVAGG